MPSGPMVAGSMPAWKPHRPDDPAGSRSSWPGPPSPSSSRRSCPCSPRWAPSTSPTTCGRARRFSRGTSLGSIPTPSRCAGTPWLDQQWGAQGIFAGDLPGGRLADARGGAGPVGRDHVLPGVPRGQERGRPRADRVAAHAGWVPGRLAGLGMRPQLLALPLFAALLWVTAGRATHPGRLWLAPVLAAMAANLHGSFTLFPLVVGLAWLEDRRTRAPHRPADAPHRGRDRGWRRS